MYYVELYVYSIHENFFKGRHESEEFRSTILSLHFQFI